MIYLASPYTSDQPAERYFRYHMAATVAARLIEQGHVVFSPITHSHPIAERMSNPDDTVSWEVWSKLCLEFLGHSKEMWILGLPGWVTSKGVAAEMTYALENGIPVKMVSTGPEGELTLTTLQEVK